MIELPIWVFVTGLAGVLSIFGAAVWRMRGFTADTAELAAALRATTNNIEGALRAQYEKMRREITEEIARSRHQTIERVIGNLSEVKMALDDKVNKDVYAQQIHALERRQDFVERLVTSRAGGSEHTGHA